MLDLFSFVLGGFTYLALYHLCAFLGKKLNSKRGKKSGKGFYIKKDKE